MQIVTDIQEILRQAQQSAVRSINTAILEAYWLVGRRIVEEEQQGESRAAYGKSLMKNLSEELRKEFGKGFLLITWKTGKHETFLCCILISPAMSANLSKSETLSRILQMPDFELSWSHYQMLMR